MMQESPDALILRNARGNSAGLSDLVTLSERLHKNPWDEDALTHFFTDPSNGATLVYAPDGKLAGFVLFTAASKDVRLVDLQINPLYQRTLYPKAHLLKLDESLIRTYADFTNEKNILGTPAGYLYQHLNAIISEFEYQSLDFAGMTDEPVARELLRAIVKFAPGFETSATLDALFETVDGMDWKSLDSANAEHDLPIGRTIAQAREKLVKATGVEWDIKRKKTYFVREKNPHKLESADDYYFVSSNPLVNPLAVYSAIRRKACIDESWDDRVKLKDVSGPVALPAAWAADILKADIPDNSLADMCQPRSKSLRRGSDFGKSIMPLG